MKHLKINQKLISINFTMKKNASFFLPFILALVFIVISCRENVLLPEQYTTTINEPIQKNEQNSYSFTINAQNISIDVVNVAQFTSHTSRITISIQDYSSGNVSVRVNDKEMNSRFSYFGNEDEDLYTESLIGYVPGSISISTVNFTGILSIRLNRTF